MPAETEPSPSAGSEEQASGWSTWVKVLIALTLGVVAVIVYGYLARPGWVGVSGKKFWDYLDLLFVPVALAVGGFLLERSQRYREQVAEDRQKEREQMAERTQRERELAVEKQRAQDAALDTYLDKMEVMLGGLPFVLRKLQLASSKGEEGEASVQAAELTNTLRMARTRTLTLLERVDPSRKRVVMRFLRESILLNKNTPSTISLDDADFSDADLRRMRLDHKDLKGIRLTRANLDEAGLQGADLRGADLTGASGITDDELRHASSLEGATMPNGQKYEDWIKNKEGRGQAGENSGPS
jgi:uncharacterized protein YjbI with pentapeptide repeats